MLSNSILDSFKGAFRKSDNALIQIILINIAVFVFMRVIEVLLVVTGWGELFRFVFDQFKLPSNPEGLVQRPWTIITYFFAHYDVMHIAFNMLNLYWFGKIVHDLLNGKRLISIYVLGGIFGGFVFFGAFNYLPYYMGFSSSLLGASAGVVAVMVAAVTVSPNYIFNLVFLGPIKIKYIALFMIASSFIGTVGENAGGEIAHLGGAAMGYVYVKLLQQGTDLGRPIMGFLLFIQGFFIPKSTLKVERPSASKKNAKWRKKPVDVQVVQDVTPQKEIDAILDKISDTGYDSLSKEEKKKLFNAPK